MTTVHDAGANLTTDTGTFPGGTYRPSDRGGDAPALIVTLSPGATINSRAGVMMEAQGTVSLKADHDITFKKLFTGGQIWQNTYTGPGSLTLAPVLLGEIVTLSVDGSAGNLPWSVSKHTYLAKTAGVKIDTKSQGLGKALFSGTDLFVYLLEGIGLVWLSTFGSVHKREVCPITCPSLCLLYLLISSY